jgi:hypothetical protein
LTSGKTSQQALDHENHPLFLQERCEK